MIRKNSGSLAFAISIERWKNRSTKTRGFGILHENVCTHVGGCRIDGKWGSEGERFPKRARIVGYWPRLENLLMTFLKLLAAIFGRSILASWVSQRATTSHVTIWVGCVKLAPEVISPWRWLHRNDYLLFSFLERIEWTPRLWNCLLRVNYRFSCYFSWALITVGRSKDDVSPTLRILVIVFILRNKQSLSLSRVPFSLWDSLKKRFEENRYSILCDRKRKGKVEKSWCSKNVNRVDPKEWWNVAITRWDYVNESVSRAKRPYANSNSGAIHYGHVIRKKMVLTVYTDFSLIYTNFEKISSNIIN